jgi:hypothetical protein
MGDVVELDAYRTPEQVVPDDHRPVLPRDAIGGWLSDPLIAGPIDPEVSKMLADRLLEWLSIAGFEVVPIRQKGIGA